MTTAHPSNDARAIEELRSKLGGRLTIVGHHYEQEDTIRHCDFRGDSLELARRVPGIASDYIVFCGVYFMAESAALLAREGQQVLLPDHSADCVMAQMTPARLLDRVLGAADMAAGDFVRSTKQTIDLLDQVSMVADGDLARTARRALDAVRRGIVAYSAV